MHMDPENPQPKLILDVMNDTNITFQNLSIFDAMRFNIHDLKNSNVSTDLYLIEIPDGLHMVFSRDFVFKTILMMQHGQQF